MSVLNFYKNDFFNFFVAKNAYYQIKQYILWHDLCVLLHILYRDNL